MGEEVGVVGSIWSWLDYNILCISVIIFDYRVIVSICERYSTLLIFVFITKIYMLEKRPPLESNGGMKCMYSQNLVGEIIFLQDQHNRKGGLLCIINLYIFMILYISIRWRNQKISWWDRTSIRFDMNILRDISPTIQLCLVRAFLRQIIQKYIMITIIIR